MAHKEIPYDLTNFFLNRDKTMFYVNLSDTESRKRKLYDIRTEVRITEMHSRMILSSLKFYGLINYFYDKKFNSYVTEYTEKGIKMRKKIIEFQSLLKKLEVW